MRILVVKPVLPYPPTQGTRRVTLAFLRAVARRHNVDLLVPLQSIREERDAAALERETGCRVVGCPAPNRRSLLHRAWYRVLYILKSLAGGHSPRALYATPGNLLREGERLSREQPYDLVVFEYWYTYRIFDRVRAARRVLLAHDYEHAVNRLAAAVPGRRRWAAREARRELEACRSVDEVWTLTREDADALAAASGVSRDRFRLFPFGVDVETLQAPPGGGRDVLFFGSYLADFNRDALDFLVGEVWPRVLRRHPSARLTVAGAGLPAARSERLRALGIRVQGEVHDLADLYRSHRIVIIPLRYGGGLRIRLLEAMACSRAVVATPVGAGTVGTGGVDLLVAGDADGLADATVLLLESPEHAAAIGASARRLVVESHSEAAAAHGLRALVEDAPHTSDAVP